MAYTGQQICDRVRDQINDDFKREIPDAEILTLINDCAKQIRLKRPDLRIGSFASSLADITLGQPFPFSDLYLTAVIDYCVAMCQRPDDEDSQAGQSQAAMTQFLKTIYGD